MISLTPRNFSLNSLLDNGHITESHIRKLEKRGYNTVGEVALIDNLRRESQAIGMSIKDLTNIILVAQKRSQFVIRRKYLTISNSPIWFDIETDLHWKKIWLIGAMDEKENKVYQFYADDWNKEIDMLIEFDQFLKNRQNKPLYHYSGNGFDINRTRNECIRLGIPNHSIFNHPEQDLCDPIRKSYYIPTRNDKLKTLAAFLGFDMSLEGRSDYMDGKECAEHYEEHVLFKIPLEPNVFTYNANDVRMLQFIVKKLEEVAISPKRM